MNSDKLPLTHHAAKLRQPRIPVPLLFHLLVFWRAHRSTILTCIAAVSLPILLPLIHLGLVFRLWDQYLHNVDKDSCSCSCWDTGFKGIYETGISSYKHVYFNLTSNTFKIWAITVVFVVVLYEVSRRILRLAYTRQLRPSMLLLTASIIYPHYYSWWSYFNYWNDDYYRQWNHQLFFSATELTSTAIVVYLLDAAVPTTVPKLLLILDIALLHILASGWDQFVSNVVRAEGNLNQVLRDLNLMWPDLLHATAPVWELCQLARATGRPPTHLISTRQFVSSLGFIGLAWLFVALL